MNNITERDLMVGDWVQYGENPTIKTRVLGISSVDNGKHWHIIAEPETANSMRIVAMHAVEPIPLTAEILEKNGFEYKEADETCATEAFHLWHLDGSRFMMDDDSWWRSVKDGELHVKFGGFPLKYLHELQHALRLAGIDKEITF